VGLIRLPTTAAREEMVMEALAAGSHLSSSSRYSSLNSTAASSKHSNSRGHAHGL
jgi:hypothetical protein